MPLLLVGLVAAGAGFAIGTQTNKILTVAVIGGVTYLVLKSKKVI